jgi:hypothetical protein
VVEAVARLGDLEEEGLAADRLSCVRASSVEEEGLAAGHLSRFHVRASGVEVVQALATYAY